MNEVERNIEKNRFDDIINVQFTSGTTGAPKAAMLTSFGIINVSNLRGSERGLETNEEDTICVNVPLYHCFGCVSANLIMACHVSE